MRSLSLSAGAFDVASGAFVNLDGTDQTVTGLSGGGCVSNGTLTVSGLLTPGGIDTLGTLTLATDTYRLERRSCGSTPRPTVPATASSSKAACRSLRPF